MDDYHMFFASIEEHPIPATPKMNGRLSTLHSSEYIVVFGCNRERFENIEIICKYRLLAPECSGWECNVVEKDIP